MQEKINKAGIDLSAIKTKEQSLNVLFKEIEKPIDNKALDYIVKTNEKIEKARLNTLNALDKVYPAIQKTFNVGYHFTGFIVKNTNKIYTPLRYITRPINKLWLRWYLRAFHSNNNEYTTDYLDIEGVHYITAGMGGGKSSLAFAKMKDNAFLTGKASYVTTMMEKPKTSIFGYKYVYHKFFELQEFWADGEKKKNLNSHRFNMIVFDEIFLMMNHRKNKEKTYNETFIPMINSTVSMRHDGIQRILYLSQQPAMDVQVMNVADYYHEITKIEKGIHYKTWLRTGDERASYTILRWHINTYKRIINQGGQKINVLLSQWVKENNVDYLSDFQSLNLKDRNSNLELDTSFYSSGWINKLQRRNH